MTTQTSSWGALADNTTTSSNARGPSTYGGSNGSSNSRTTTTTSRTSTSSGHGHHHHLNLAAFSTYANGLDIDYTIPPSANLHQEYAMGLIPDD